MPSPLRKALIIAELPIVRVGLRQLVKRLDPTIEVVAADSLASASQAEILGQPFSLAIVDGTLIDTVSPVIVSPLLTALASAPVIALTSPGALAGVNRPVFPVEVSTATDTAALLSILRLIESGGIRFPCPPPQPPAVSLPPLTRRQRDVLALMAAGLPNQEIAQRLGLRLPTIKHHVSTILSALGVNNRRKAILLYRERL